MKWVQTVKCHFAVQSLLLVELESKTIYATLDVENGVKVGAR